MSRHTTLRAEQLETRDLPASTYMWRMPMGGDQKWSTAGNWQVGGNTAITPPGPSDTVVFDSGNMAGSTADVPSVYKLDIQNGYTGLIQIDESITDFNINTISMSSSSARLYDWIGANVNVSSNLSWSAGAIAGARVRIGSQTNSLATGTINPVADLQNNVFGEVVLGSSAAGPCVFENYGTLTWASGNITCRTGNTSVENYGT